MRDLRIVSLLPSATEIVCALGLREALVARSHECDFPAGVERLPFCTQPRFEIGGGSSREIDGAVRSLAAEARAADALGVYRIDLDQLRGLAPTHIITQTQCEVCAVSLREVEAAVEALVGFETAVVPLAPNTLADIGDDIRRTGAALGAERAADELAASIDSRISEIAERAAALSAPLTAVPPAAVPSVAVIEWADPFMTAGHWTMEQVVLAGGRPVIGEPEGPSLRFEWDDLAAADPDVIIVSPCGFALERAWRDAELLAADRRWAALRAVRSGRVAVIDGNQFINRPGPRVAESQEIIAEILHPDEFDFGHRGRDWRPFDA